VSWIKANPEKAQCGLVTVGSEGHLMAYSFAREAGIQLNFVPYKGGAPMAQDLMAGHIPMVFDALPNLIQPHRAGKIRVLAVTSAQSAIQLPEVPTLASSGYASATGESWIGVAAKRGTPAKRIQAIASAFAVAANLPELRTKLIGAGLTVRAGGPAEMSAAMNADTTRYSALVSALNLQLD
jgi:tripartite-type tricarboxylate transporter receptor subunit TctC